MDNTKKIQEFIQWLPSKFEEFQNKTPDEVAQTLNELYKSDEGKKTIETLWNTFTDESEKSKLFKEGGKLNYLINKFKSGGKTTNKCTCGCELHQVMENGGIIEKCACGCKTKSKLKLQDGNKIPIQETSWFERKMDRPYTTTKVNDDKGVANIAQMLSKKNTMYRVIERPSGGYINKTWQVIDNYNTPKADTIYVTPRGNTLTTDKAPSWTLKFDEFFGTKKKK